MEKSALIDGLIPDFTPSSFPAGPIKGFLDDLKKRSGLRLGPEEEGTA